MNWHYVEQGQQVGPVSDEQLADLNRTGRINADTLIWCEGMTDWLPFHKVKLEPNPAAGQTGAAETRTSPPTNPNEAVCAECGKTFPLDETILHGKSHICASCKPVFIQKLSEGAPINTGELNYAGFGIRFGAKFLDGIILGIPMMAIFFALMFPWIRLHAHNNQPNNLQGFQIVPILIEFALFAVQIGYQTFFLGKYGATPGKMLCKLQVVTAEGGRIGYGRAAGRAFAEILSGMLCYIGYLLVLFDGQKRALHDHICNTRVIQR